MLSTPMLLSSRASRCSLVKFPVTTYRKPAFASSPPAGALPPPVFDECAVVPRQIHAEAKNLENRSNECPYAATAPSPTSTPVEHFDAMKAQSISKWYPHPKCPCWSEWALGQFTLDYLCTLLTSSQSPELFSQQYPEQYLDAVFKLSSIISSLGKMPDHSPPPSFYQSFYYLRRLFPNGLLSLEDFAGNIRSALIIRVFVLGIVVANQAIYEQRNYNLDWYEICGIPDFYVDALEAIALSALGRDVFDLAENRMEYLHCLGHLGYHAEYHYRRSMRPYLRNSADIIAFAHSQASSLPPSSRCHTSPVHAPSWQTLIDMLWWDIDCSSINFLRTPHNYFVHI